MRGGPSWVGRVYSSICLVSLWQVVLLECITSSTILLKSKVQLLEKTGVPPYYNLKHVKVVDREQVELEYS